MAHRYDRAQLLGSGPPAPDEPQGRYASGDVLFTTDASTPVPYLQRRFLPQGTELTTFLRVEPKPEERLDQIAARTLGSPLDWWCIADAEDAMSPAELLDGQRRTLRVPIPGVDPDVDPETEGAP